MTHDSWICGTRVNNDCKFFFIIYLSSCLRTFAIKYWTNMQNKTWYVDLWGFPRLDVSWNVNVRCLNINVNMSWRNWCNEIKYCCICCLLSQACASLINRALLFTVSDIRITSMYIRKMYKPFSTLNFIKKTKTHYSKCLSSFAFSAEH